MEDDKEVDNNCDSEATPRPPVNDVKKSCTFFMTDKRRKCRMSALDGQATCVIHFEDPQRRRIDCPLDPKHTVFAYLLEKHLTKCNARKTERLHPFYSLGINDGGSSGTTLGVSLKALDDTQLLKLVDKINSVAELHLPDAAFEIGFGSCNLLQDEIDSPLNGNEARRHLRQTSSILHFLEKQNCLNPHTCFIEFGSGKGGLTYWIAQTLESLPHPDTQSFVLVDRSSPRHKRDNKLQLTDFKVERIRIDIKDLKLDEVSFVSKSRHLIGVSKHLCGEATDLALRCLLDTNSLVKNVSGIIFATCCHHQCEWNTFVGKKTFLDWGFTEEEFRPLSGITSWNVCGTGTGKFANSSEDGNSLKYSKLDLGLEERRLIGWKAKRLLDYCRCLYIRAHGFESRYSTFASSEDTYENVCIVGLKPKPMKSAGNAGNAGNPGSQKP